MQDLFPIPVFFGPASHVVVGLSLLQSLQYPLVFGRDLHQLFLPVLAVQTLFAKHVVLRSLDVAHDWRKR